MLLPEMYPTRPPIWQVPRRNERHDELKAGTSGRRCLKRPAVQEVGYAFRVGGYAVPDDGRKVECEAVIEDLARMAAQQKQAACMSSCVDS